MTADANSAGAYVSAGDYVRRVVMKAAKKRGKMLLAGIAAAVLVFGLLGMSCSKVSKVSVDGTWIPDRPIMESDNGNVVFIFNKNKFSFAIRDFSYLEVALTGTYDDERIYITDVTAGSEFDEDDWVGEIWSYELIGNDQMSIAFGEYSESIFLFHREKPQ
jgi:hypothetical protein